MSRLSHAHEALHFAKRAPNPDARPLPIPLERLNSADVFRRAATLVARAPASAATTSECPKGDNSAGCQKPVSSNTATLPIVLGVVIPISVAIVLFIILHRKYLKKLRQEDAEDKHKSLDFGLDIGPASGRKKGPNGIPEMTVTTSETEKALRSGRGMSMDMGSPYLLPPEVDKSRESLHTLSRTLSNASDDKYRPVTAFVASDSSSLRSYPNSTRGRADDASIYTNSSDGFGSSADLLKNAQRISRSSPPLRKSSMADMVIPEVRTSQETRGDVHEGSPSMLNGGLVSPSAAESDNGDMRKSDNYLGALIQSQEPSEDLQQKGTDDAHSDLQPTDARKAPPPAIRTVSVDGKSEQAYMDDGDFGDGFKITPPSPSVSDHHAPGARRQSLDLVEETSPSGGLDAPGLGYDIRRLSMGIRPLPPDDPTDNPEQRANRIRSFYKEYFDDSKGPAAAGEGGYYDAYDLDDAAIYDPSTGQFVVAGAPYAQPVNRRAMTPPPRAPRLRGARNMSGGPVAGGPRAFSSASGRLAVGPKKPLPPPSPLRILPTPHMLKDDMADLVPIDYAPPTTYRDRQAGRPESPLGGLKQYNPLVRAHTPLVSAFDDLAVMPSPHALRKSGTFTALDFAAPPRFQNSNSGSDAGSIRSNRSNRSALQVQNIRAGAYRLSRIPKDVVGTRDDLSVSLKPSWDLRAK
ncbi:MAG: hypothetical protein M1819_002048 [Sarea resinae]|nr:MAG: hypothetical protein M1819_002048 [Sarea resinae]